MHVEMFPRLKGWILRQVPNYSKMKTFLKKNVLKNESCSCCNTVGAFGCFECCGIRSMLQRLNADCQLIAVSVCRTTTWWSCARQRWMSRLGGSFMCLCGPRESSTCRGLPSKTRIWWEPSESVTDLAFKYANDLIDRFITNLSTCLSRSVKSISKMRQVEMKGCTCSSRSS